MATTPRKFSEKIALHNQKQAEGDAAYQQIMREVQVVTNNSAARSSKKLLRSTQSIGGGSLPNVNNITSQTNIPTTTSFVKPPRNNLEETRPSRVDSQVVYRERGRAGSVGPMRQRPAERRIDTSPYPSGSYLSPPTTDPGWRRTSSDSALHQSVQNTNNTLYYSPGSQRRALDNQIYDPSRTRHLSVSSDDRRPKSCCSVPSPIPHINIFPSQADLGPPQIPICNKNTGSLPDLSSFQSSFQFSPPMGTLDPDDHNSPTYSSGSPQCTSPSTLSPTSLPPRTPGRFSFGSTPPHENSDPNSFASVSPPSPSASKHLSVPIAGSGYMRSPKGYMLEGGSPIESYSIQSQIMQQQQQQQQQQQHQQHQQQPPLRKQPPQLVNHQQHQQHNMSKQQMMHQQPQSASQNHQPSMQPQMTSQYTYQQTPSPHRQSPVSPVDVSTSDSIIHQRPSMTSYRSPQSTSRPSPQSSPVLNIKPFSNNTSPLSSAPQSPTSPCDSQSSNNVAQSYNSSNDYYVNHQAQETLQQHFEQIRMLAESPDSTSIDYIINNSPSSSYQQTDDINVPSNDLIADPGFYNASMSQQLQYHSQTTPNTPSSIPDIVLSDYSTENDDIRRNGSKNFGCDMIFPSGDGLSDGLDPELDLTMFTQEFLTNDPSQQHYAVDH